jgi:hypothetical protein
MADPLTIRLLNCPQTRFAWIPQGLGEETTVELGLDPSTALAGHQEAKDVVALGYQRSAIDHLAVSCVAFVAESPSLVRGQRVVGHCDPTPIPEFRPPMAMRRPIPRDVDRLIAA